MPAPHPSVIILTFDRRDALARTLRELAAQGLADITVVDNASRDGTREMLGNDFPHVRVVTMPRNVGVTGYNVGVREAKSDYLLILDDDSWPDKGVVEQAVDFLAANTRTAAVALLPRHPGTFADEWRFAPKVSRSFWPVMGCGNVVRREAWQAVGGYEELFFLYRNDTDLALKLLASGRDVHFNPAWVVWHDSPGAAQKSEAWLKYATRNWVWMCRRHGRGLWKYGAQAAGVAWAARLAGLNMSRLGEVLRGARDGFRHHAPAMPATVAPDGSALRELVRLQVGSRVRGA
jgi:GT2 family glycosyltransferase